MYFWRQIYPLNLIFLDALWGKMSQRPYLEFKFWAPKHPARHARPEPVYFLAQHYHGSCLTQPTDLDTPSLARYWMGHGLPVACWPSQQVKSGPAWVVLGRCGPLGPLATFSFQQGVLFWYFAFAYELGALWLLYSHLFPKWFKS